MSHLPCITIHQPYASLIMAGIKTWETRPSPPHGDMCTDGVRGLPGLRINADDRIAIHAGAKRITPWERTGYWEHRSAALGRDFLMLRHNGWLPESVPNMIEMRYGAILGTVAVEYVAPVVFLDDAAPAGWEDDQPVIETSRDDAKGRMLILWSNGDTDGHDELISDQAPYGDWVPGRWAWRLTNPEPFDEPIPAKGRQGVWRWEL